METITTIHIIVTAFGWLTHHLSVLGEQSSGSDGMVSPISYITRAPYQFITSIIGASLGFIILSLQFSDLDLSNNDVNVLYLMSLFGAGFVPSGILSRAGVASNKQFEKIK